MCTDVALHERIYYFQRLGMIDFFEHAANCHCRKSSILFENTFTCQASVIHTL